MKIDWQVDDGYMGGSRPQVTEIDDEELLEYDSIGEILDYIDEAVDEDFQSMIGWNYNSYEEVVKEINELFEKKEE